MPPKGKKVSKRKSASQKDGEKKNVSLQEKAGTVFPVTRCARYMKEKRLAPRISVTAGACMAAVLEYICGELIEASGEICEQHKNKIITARHLNLAVR